MAGVWRFLTMACLVLATPARALDWASLAFSDVVFASLESDVDSTFLTSGGKRTLTVPGSDVRGFVLTSAGLSLSDARRFNRGRMRLDEIDRQARLLIGFERSEGPVFVALGLGPSMAQVRNATGGGHLAYGVALQADLWIRPRSNLYLALSSAADSASHNWWNRARLGYRPDGLPFAFGPEFNASVARNSGKIKLGLHVGEAQIWKLNVDVSGGVMWTENLRPGGYVSLAAHIRY